MVTTSAQTTTLTPARSVLAIRTGMAFDGERMIGPATILVDRGRIIDVDTTGAPPPEGATVFDAGAGACVLPGLIDAHVHLCLDASQSGVSGLAALGDASLLARMRGEAERTLRAGVTSVRDLGDRGYLALTLRDEIAAGIVAGPTVVAAGPPITVRGGHFSDLGGAAEGRRALRAAVRERSRRGCEVVKVMASGGHLTPGSNPHLSQYTLDELRLVADEAHQLGLLAAAHAHGSGAIADAVDAGFDTIEHVTFFTEAGVRADPRTIERIVQRQVVVSATLGMVEGKGGPPPAVAAHVGTIKANLSALHRAGARIVVGSDAGVGPAKPHGVLPHGVCALTEIGMTNAEALRAVTTVAADACGLAGRKGRIVPGADADLIVVGGNPLSDIRAIHAVRAVLRSGMWLSASDS